MWLVFKNTKDTNRQPLPTLHLLLCNLKKKLIWSNMSKMWFDLCSKGTRANSTCTYIQEHQMNQNKIVNKNIGNIYLHTPRTLPLKSPIYWTASNNYWQLSSSSPEHPKHPKHKVRATSVDTNLATYFETCIARKWKMGASCTTTPRLEIETLNRFENGLIILAHGQNFPSRANDMLLVMILSQYNVLYLICLLEGLGIISS